MIQKKSLKDAIQNPEIISVVGGLIGDATKDKSGLMTSKTYTQCMYFKPFDTYIAPGNSRILKFTRNILSKFIVTSDSGQFKEYFVYISAFGNTVKTDSVAVSFTTKFYYDTSYGYMKVTAGPNGLNFLCSGFTDGNFSVSHGSDGDISNATELPITTF